jgi:hypothetical protein
MKVNGDRKENENNNNNIDANNNHKAKSASRKRIEHVISKYGKMFDRKNIDSLTRENFGSFLNYGNNRHWNSDFGTNSLCNSCVCQIRNHVCFDVCTEFE